MNRYDIAIKKPAPPKPKVAVNKESPNTVKESVERLMVELNDEDKIYIKNMKENDLIQLHHGLGQAIRNKFGLWGSNPAEKGLLRDTGKSHPDDASMVIIVALWDKLQETK